MKHAIYQMDVVSGKPEKNRDKVWQWADKVMRDESPDVLVLPELWVTSYAYDTLSDIADREGQPTADFLSALASRHHVNIVGGSIANRRGDAIYNSALVYNRDGQQVCLYDKVHIATSMDEHLHFTGNTIPPTIFTVDGVKAGVIICYDLRFPEISRPLAIKGIELLYVLAAWPLKRIAHWNALLKARAIENQLFAIGCGRVGECEGTILGGRSAAYDPYGDVLGQCSETAEETLCISLDLNLVASMRKTVTVFADRLPCAYSSL